ncbi:hypothetical protein [Gemmatimonas sp.]|uniref:hypothetical protein n=1 Tax=Gemmatimonas sp. TaxID=1962908 RepID=UPI003341AA0A
MHSSTVLPRSSTTPGSVFTPRIEERLLLLIYHPKARVRCMGLLVGSFTKLPRVLCAIPGRLRDPQASVRRLALRLLARVDGCDWEYALPFGLQDTSSAVRRFAWRLALARRAHIDVPLVMSLAQEESDMQVTRLIGEYLVAAGQPSPSVRQAH